jgi:hypothetical protein
MASIVEWQSLKMQEYRYSLISNIAILASALPVWGATHALHAGASWRITITPCTWITRMPLRCWSNI